MVERLRSLALFVRAFLRRDKLEARLQEELQLHVDLLAEKNMRLGMPPQEARRQARIALGAFAQVREECRDARRFGAIEDLARDLRYGLRQFRRAPGFAAMAIVTLALGIAATTAVFSLVNATLLPVLPYRDAGRLVEISITDPRRSDAGPILINDFEYTPWKQSTRSCERIGAFFEGDYTLAGGGAAEFPVPVHVAWVSEDFFPILGVAATIGRTFQPADYPQGLVKFPGLPVAQRQFGPDEVPPIVISNGLFQSRLGGNRALLEQIVQIPDFPIAGRRFRVIGVMPDEFQFPQDTDVWFPQSQVECGFLIARLARGSSKEQAKAELDVALLSAKPPGMSNVPQPPGFQPTPVPERLSKVVSLREYVGGDVRTSLLVLLGAVGLVMLIACLNVTNLLLLRNQKRGHEMSVRAALGASRSRLARQTLAESALLALAGGAGGILLAWWMIRGLPRLAPLGLLPKAGVALDARVLLFAVLVTALTGIFVGLLPALRRPRTSLSESLKQTGGHEGTSGRAVAHGVLVAAQVALTLILLCGAGLMIRSFMLLRGVTPAFRSANILKFEVSVNAFKGDPSRSSQARAKANAYGNQFYARMIEQLQSLPGGKRVSISNALPGSRTSPGSERKDQPAVVTRVSLGYFEMLGIPLIAGRSFTATDNRPDAPKVAIINRTAARSWFGAEDPVGKSPGDGTPVVIVGVASDVKQLSVSQTIYPEIYRPILQSDVPWKLSIMVETQQDPAASVNAIRRVMAGIDPEVPIYRPMTMREYIGSTLARDRFAMLLLTLFAAITLVLAAVGVYSVTAQSVEQRLREIAVRMALGARPAEVMKLVLVRGSVQIATGVVAGLLGAVGFTRVLTSLLYEVKPGDPGVFSGAFVLLVLVAFLACYGPARRATKVDPLTILRAE